MKILVINAGSSSLKCKLFDVTECTQLCSAIVDGIAQSQCEIRLSTKSKKYSQKKAIKNHTEAMKALLSTLCEQKIINDTSEICAVGHRVVHGGKQYTKPTIITKKVLQTIKKLSALAPLHNPINYEGIVACQKFLPKVSHVAVFDTAFHQTIPQHAALYAVPQNWYTKHHVKKYGFHGTSHQYVGTLAHKYLKKRRSRLISCHIGNGISITAIKNGKSIDTSMGFTPLEGVPMGTRSGNIDPAIIPYVMQCEKKSAEVIIDALNHKSGLLGVSGISSDMRLIWENIQKKNPRAIQALQIMSYHIAQYISAYMMTLGGCEAIIFTAGIGENAWYVRKAIINQLSIFNITLDSKLNKKAVDPKHIIKISTPKSAIPVLVIPTNEEKAIALATKKLMKKAPLLKKKKA